MRGNGGVGHQAGGVIFDFVAGNIARQGACHIAACSHAETNSHIRNLVDGLSLDESVLHIPSAALYIGLGIRITLDDGDSCTTGQIGAGAGADGKSVSAAGDVRITVSQKIYVSLAATGGSSTNISVIHFSQGIGVHLYLANTALGRNARLLVRVDTYSAAQS